MDFDAGQVIGELLAMGNPERAVQEKRYLKSERDFLGVSLPAIRKVVRAALPSPRTPVSRADVRSWALELWDDTLFERRLAAVELLGARAGSLTADDLPLIESLIRKAAGWALVDPLSGDIAGRIALAHPGGSWPRIDVWAGDKDFWVRRSALLSLLPGIRAGQPDTARFDRYALGMLGESEFFIRKAIGWVLRELSKKDPGYVAVWTGRHIAEMSGVTFREAVRRLPASDAERLTAERKRL